MNKPAVPDITKEEIYQLMDYDSSSGLIWKVSRGRFARPGMRVGGKTRGQVRLNGIRVYTSHIVWFLHNDFWPSEKGLWIDHIDGNVLNGTIQNLRLATSEQNNANRQPRKNRDLPKGVYIRQGKYDSRIQWKGQVIFLGLFDTVGEAEAAYQGASRALQREFSFYNRQELSKNQHPVSIIIEKEQQE